MGARLVTLVLARWTHVSDRGFRLLVRMALTALDESNGGVPASMYFGGHDMLAETLRTKSGTPATRRREVRAVVAELVEAGAVARVSGSAPGARAVYEMTLNGARSIDTHPVDNPPADSAMEGVTPPITEGVSAHNGGGLTTSLEGVTPPPKEPRGTTEELSEDRRGSTTTEVSLLRATRPGSSPKVATDECPQCGMAFDPGGLCGNRRCRDPTPLAEIIPLRRTA